MLPNYGDQLLHQLYRTRAVISINEDHISYFNYTSIKITACKGTLAVVMGITVILIEIKVDQMIPSSYISSLLVSSL